MVRLLPKQRQGSVAMGGMGGLSSRAIVMQQETLRPVQFEITKQTRSAQPICMCRERLDTVIKDAELFNKNSRRATEINDSYYSKDSISAEG